MTHVPATSEHPVTDATPPLAAACPPDWAVTLFDWPLAPVGFRSDGGVGVWSIAGDRTTARISQQFKAAAGAAKRLLMLEGALVLTKGA